MPLVSKLPIIFIIISVVRPSDTGNELTCCALCCLVYLARQRHKTTVKTTHAISCASTFIFQPKKKSSTKISPVAYYEIGPPGIGNIFNASPLLPLCVFFNETYTENTWLAWIKSVQALAEPRLNWKHRLTNKYSLCTRIEKNKTLHFSRGTLRTRKHYTRFYVCVHFPNILEVK